jgi:hypothetical protein
MAPLPNRLSRCQCPPGTVTEPLRVRVERGQNAVTLLDTRWDALMLRQSIPNPTLSAIWLREMAGWGSGTPLVIVVESRDRLVAGGAFQVVRPLGRFGPRLATYLGRNGRPVLKPDILVDPDLPDAGFLLIDALLHEVHAVLIGPTVHDGPISVLLHERAPWLNFRSEADGWIVPLPPPTLERRQKEAAYHLRRAEKLGASVSVSVLKEPEAVLPGLDRLFVLHQQRWTGRSDESYFSATESQRTWHRHAVAAMAAHGAARLVEVFEDDQLVASSLGFIAGSGALFHTTATQVGGRLRGSGHIALLALVEAATEAGATFMYLGSGGGPGGPKADLEPVRAPLGSFLVARSPAAQRFFNASLSLHAAARVAPRGLIDRWRRAIHAAERNVMRILKTVKASGPGRIRGVCGKFTGAFLSELLTADEKTRLTKRLYNAFPHAKGTARAPWGERLGAWEETWFARRLPKAPARILVGACGAGREAVGLIEKGFQVDAFDLAPRLASLTAGVVGDRGRVLTFSYEDLADAVLDNVSGTAATFGRERYAAVLLGWGSLTHVMDASQRARLFHALDILCPQGPILASFWCTNGFAPEMSAPGRAEHCGYALGRIVARLRGTRPQYSSPQSFRLQRGFGYTFEPQEIDDLGLLINRQVLWEQDDTTYAHVTFLRKL